eukprot:symbB.v1.2.035493.t1/scaffold4790.1/size34862/1
MKAQVAEALENLARVLRASEEEWEVVSQGEEPRSSPREGGSKAASCATPKVTGSTVAYHRDVRCYLVFSNPNDPKSVGFWKGENVVAMTIRLTTRLVVALVMRVFREVAVELGRVLTQLSSLTSGLEQALVQYLDSMMVELLPTSLLVLPGSGGEQGPGEEILARSGQSAGLGDNSPRALPTNF